MDYSELLRHVDHTLLTPTATWDQVKTVCDEGLTCRGSGRDRHGG